MFSIPEDLKAAFSDRYELSEELGRGGMATVYRAVDRRHGRQVAIKVLEPSLALALGPSRFLREIEIAANLTHPHILPVHDSGESAGFLFYVMPFVEGSTLRQRIADEGALSVAEALHITGQIADALDYAHRQGVVHRDVKPGNILLSGGNAYIADFGIARAAALSGTTELTNTGIAVGTPTYMSPEQAAGQKDIDGRSDIYSLGCVLYEALVGDPPFTGDTPQSVIVKRITERPIPVRRLRSEVPPSVERALAKSLEPNPAQRYQTTGDFADDLHPAGGVGRRLMSLLRRWRYVTRSRLAGRPVLTFGLGAAVLGLFVAGLGALLVGTGRIGAPSPSTTGSADVEGGGTTIAVLHFDDMSADGSLTAYARGFTDHLIHSVNRVEGLAAPSLLAVRQFRDSDTPPDAIATALQADFIVHGSVLGGPQRMRVNVSLIDPTTGQSLGDARVEAPPGEILGLVDGVTDSLSFFLRPAVGHEVRMQELRSGTGSDDAWTLVWEAEALRDRHIELIEQADREGADRALVSADSLLEIAESLDPSWAEPTLARGWIASQRALVFSSEPGEYDAESEELLRDGLAHAERARTLEGESAAVLTLRGMLNFGLARIQQSDAGRASLLDASEADLRAATEADPALAEAWRGLGRLLEYHRADFPGAKAAYERAYASDRFLEDADEIALALGEISTDLEDYDDAMRWYREGRTRWPDDVGFAGLGLITLASRSGPDDVNLAWALTDTIAEIASLDRQSLFYPIMYAQVASVLARAELEDSARAVLALAESRSDEAPDFFAYDLAHAWLVIGDTARSLDWLEVDLEANPGDRPERAREPWFRPLHGNPRFEELVGHDVSYATEPGT
ncbi:MAG: protein kinase [Gemmatimonadetes bacterium]|nr:protein kinase [Gemmatimonadota bacterium]